jgi:hypothetical protein
MRTVKSLMLLAALLPGAAVPADAEQLQEQLRLDHAAWTAAERDFHARRERGTLTGAEASEYAGYVARLRRRVAEDCVAVARAAVAVPDDMSCPRFTAAVLTRSAAIDQTAEQTRQERLAAMDAELAAGLGNFDELLLREQERVKAKANATRSGSGGASGQGGGGAENGGAAPGSGATGSGKTETGAAAAGDRKPTPDGGIVARSSTGAGGGAVNTPLPGARRPPPGIPDGSDDDVVARQLREAAEKETDPELRKKLWEEYRKYKQGTR